MVTDKILSLEHLVNGIIIVSFFEVIVLCIFLKTFKKIIKHEFFF